MRAGARGVRLEPPFGNGVLRARFGAIGLEHRVDAAHGIGAALTGAKHDGFACVVCVMHGIVTPGQPAIVKVSWTGRTCGILHVTNKPVLVDASYVEFVTGK